MWQNIKDYTKCAVRNRFTLAGYLSLATWGVLHFVEYKTQTPVNDLFYLLSFSGAAFGLLPTAFGADTLNAYIRTKKHIQKHDEPDKRYLDIYSHLYCSRVGIQLAVKEAGLEYLVEDKD